MKKFAKLLSLVLACLMAFSAFVACDDKTTASENEEKTTETIAQETELVHPDIAKKNYGADYFLHIHGDVNPKKFYWVEESENDVLSQAIYERQQRVSTYLGVEIQGLNTPTESRYIEPFKTAVKNKDGSVHTLITHNYQGIPSLVSENFFADLTTVSQIDLESDHWNYEFMESISVKDHMYLGFSNFNILYTNVITFNKDLLEKYSDALDKSLYQTVTDYEWTLDEMISLANLAYVDKTADGKSRDDQFGIAGLQAVPFVNFIHGSDINLVDLSESGDYKVSVYNSVNAPKTAVLVEKLHELSKSDCSWFWSFQSPDAIEFVTGTSLLYLSPSISLPDYLDYDINFGVVPYPMFDENQKNVGYRSLQWGGYLTLPSYVDNMDMAADTLEMLSFFSEDVNTAFYEKLLGKQVADTTDDKKMLELIWDSVCSDFGQTYYECMSSTGVLYMLGNLTRADTSSNLASFMAKVDKSADKFIKKFMDNID